MRRGAVPACFDASNTAFLARSGWVFQVRADIFSLEALVKGLREGRRQVKPVLQLLRQQHRYLKLGALAPWPLKAWR